jgi:cysteine desulfurase / selenocysteine lyase
MAIDLERARAETPGCRERVHFNNAGASLMPSPVVEAVVDHLRLEAQIGGYEARAAVEGEIERTYDAAAELIGAERDEIALLENATRAWDAIFYGLPFSPGDRILTSVAEYSSNYIAYLHVAAKAAVEIVVIENDDDGQLDVGQLARAVDDRAKLISITHVPTSGGVVNPAVDIGRVAREAGVLYLLDACQSVGQMPIDVDEIGCDFLTTTGRKFLRGPRGTGFLYARRSSVERVEPPVLDTRSARWIERDRYLVAPGARRFETWEVSYALQLGLGVALRYAIGWGIEAIWERVLYLSGVLRARLGEIPGVTTHDLGVVKCGIVTFSVAGRGADEIEAELRLRGFNTSVSQRDDTLLDFDARALDRIVRASVHYFNTDEEVERFCTAVERFT